MNKIKPLVDGKYLLQKFPGKGGWTYARIPEVLQNKKNPFGWVQVKGNIDDFEFHHYKLMPMGDGQLFLPVKSQIRKHIKKEAGDYVHIILYMDESDLPIPEEIRECFQTESPKVYEKFLALPDGKKKMYLDCIYEAKTESTKVMRIVKMIDNIKNSSPNLQ